MSKQITVIVTTWCVPFDQTVKGIYHFATEATAVAFINKASRKWWDENDGDKCITERAGEESKYDGAPLEPYEPITELGYNTAYYELWGGEQGFHAMLGHKTYAALNEAHYAGKPLPGYLLVAKLSGHWPK